MKFGLRTQLMSALREGKEDEFIDSLSPADKVEMMRDLDTFADPSLRAVDASFMFDKYNVYTDITKMTLTQFIMLEHTLQSEVISESDIASIVIRPKDEPEFDNTNQEVEDSLINSIYEEEAESVAFIIKSMLHNRDYILFTKFDGVLYTKIEKEESVEEDEDEDNGPDPFVQRWFWYSIVRSLANEDLQKFQFVYDMRMSDVLVELAYKAQLNERMENERRAEEARSRAYSRR